MRFAQRCGLLLCMAAAFPALPSRADQPQAGDALEQVFSFDIAAQDLGPALVLLGQQSGFQVVMSVETVGSRRTAGIHGSMAVRAALGQLLGGSALGYHLVGHGTIAIDPPAPGRPGGGQAAGGAAIPLGAGQGGGPDAGSGPSQLAEVVVTATKRSERLRDIPQSITAFSGARLEKEGKLNLNDYVQEAPGVTASQAGSGSTRITMRGINTDASPLAGEVSPVGVFIGDVPFTDSYIVNITPDLSAFDLKDVEILKGPQGTLFGGSALAGAVRYQLEDPVLGEWEGRGFSQYIHPTGGGAAFTSGAAANLPLYSDKLALRLVYVDRHLPGVTDDTRNDIKNVDHGSGDQVRAILLWQPLASTKLKLTHLTQKYSAPDFLLPDHPDQHINDVDVVPNLIRNKFGMDSVELGYDFDGMRFTSLSSRVTKNNLQHTDDTFALIGAPPAGYPDDLTVVVPGTADSVSVNQELRLQSTGDGPLSWLAGAFYTRYRMHWTFEIDTQIDQQLTGPGSLGAGLANILGIPLSALDNTKLLTSVADARTEERALFGDIKYTLWKRLDLNFGARFYQTYLDGGFKGSGLVVLAENNGADTDTSSNLKQTGFNPKAAITYHFGPDISLYAAAAKGFRFGGINDIPATATNGVPNTYKSDTLWNYELGLRTDWLHRTLRADLTLFDIQYDNPIISQSTQGPISLAYNTNVSAAVSRGLETNLLWNTPLKGLNLSFNGALTDAHITKPYTAANGQQIEPGQEMPGAARLQYTGAVHYLRSVGMVMAGAGTSYTYIGRGWTDLQHTSPCNGYGVLNAGVTLSSPGLRLEPTLAINVANILNVTKPNASSINTSLTGQALDLYTLTPPRTLNVRLSLDF